MRASSAFASFCVALLLASSPAAIADTDYDSGDDPNDQVSGGGYKKRNLSTSYFPQEEVYVDPFATPSDTPTYIGDLDCGDPGTAQAMQDVVDSGGLDDPHDLDHDGDGRPCEW